MIAGCLLFALPIFSFSQKHWEVGITPGVMNYYGDLTAPLFTVKEVFAGGQISVRRYFDREHAIRVNILHGKLAGDDHNFDRNYERGNKFEGLLTEFSVMGELDFKGRKRFSSSNDYQKMASLYLFGGGSVAYFNPTVHYGSIESKDADLDYINWHVGMPIGGGVRIDANERLVFGLELSYHFTISDFLDGTQASGNAYKNDSYTFGGISVGYRFFDKAKEAAAPEKK